MEGKSINDSSNLIWIDCEFTGLDFNKNRIVEIACVVTDSNLKVLGKPVSVVVGYTQKQLDDLLEEWPREHFKQSDLMQEILKSELSMEQAQDLVLDYVKTYCKKGESPLCGNSVGQDRRVLYTNMPKFESFLHYRTIDVSTIKELARRWNPKILDRIKKKKFHRALDDIFESIDELKIYRNLFFK